jgi:hypothetical protein
MVGLYVDRRYPNWVVEVALRYVPVAEMIRKSGLSARRILEVGSGANGIQPYLRNNYEILVGTDIDFPGDKGPLEHRVVADATRLPFAAESFDVVVCLDVLEHMTPERRGSAILEMLRVARETVYIGFPAGRGAQLQDELLDRVYAEERGHRYPFLVEHLQHPLPSEDDLHRALEQSGKVRLPVKVYRNQNLKMREWLMRWGFISRSPARRFFGRRVALLFFPILLRLNLGTCYRRIYRIEVADRPQNPKRALRLARAKDPSE